MERKFVKTTGMLVLLAMLLTVITTGCTNKNQPSSSQTSQTSSSTQELKPVEIIWNTRCPQQNDLPAVMVEVNKYLTEKINATLKLNFIDTGSYDQQIKTKMAAGENMDIVFTSNWVNDYGTNVSKGAFLPLDDLLKTYVPKSYAAIPAALWDATKIGNKIYGFINYQIVARQMAFSVQKKMIDKYSLNMTSIKKLEDVTPMLDKLKSSESAEKIIFEMSKDGIFSSLWLGHYFGFDQIGADNSPGVLQVDDTSLTVVDQFEQPNFKTHIQLMREWYNKGYIKKDAATITNLVDPRLTGNVLSFITDIKPGGDAEIKVAMGGNDMITQALDEPFVQTNSILATLNAISVASKNPERAMMLLELVNSDKYLNNLINFGIDG